MSNQQIVHAQLVMKREDGGSILDRSESGVAESTTRTAGDLSQARIEEVRRVLADAGFRVEGGNANTLSISGPAALFAEAFGLDPVAASGAGVAAHATRIRPDLGAFVADVFVPPPPTFFP